MSIKQWHVYPKVSVPFIVIVFILLNNEFEFIKCKKRFLQEFVETIKDFVQSFDTSSESIEAFSKIFKSFQEIFKGFLKIIETFQEIIEGLMKIIKTFQEIIKRLKEISEGLKEISEEPQKRPKNQNYSFLKLNNIPDRFISKNHSYTLDR